MNCQSAMRNPLKQVEEWVWLFAIVFVLAGCKTPAVTATSTQVAQATVSPSSSHTSQPTRPAASATPAVSPLATATRFPSRTPTPTDTATATPTPSQTPTATATPDLTPTQSLWLTLAPPVATGEVQLEVVNQVGGAISAVAVVGNLAYVGVGPRLVILEVSNPQNPVVVGQSDVLPAVIQDLVVANGFAYAATGTTDLWVLDVSNPARPLALSPVPITSTTYQLEIEGTRLYAVSRWFPPEEGSRWLSIVSLDNAAAPIELGAFAIDQDTSSMAVHNGYVYLPIFDYTEGALVIVDARDPAAPDSVATLPGLRGGAISISGTIAYVRDFTDMLTLDIAEPQNPVEIARETDYLFPLESVSDMVAASGKLFIAINVCDVDCGSAVQIAQVGETGDIGPGDGHGIGTIIEDIAVRDDAFFVAAGNQLVILDATNPNKIVESGRVQVGGVFHIAETDEWLYGVEPDGVLTILDRVDPIRPQVQSRFTSEFEVNDLAASNDYVYFGTYWGSLRVVEVSDPLQPQEVASLNPNHSTENTINTIIANDHLYSVVDGELSIVDISNSKEPIEVSYFHLFEPSYDFERIAIENQFIFAIRNGVESENLFVIDVSDPVNPQAVGGLDLSGNICAISLSAGYAYLLTCGDIEVAAGTLWVVNISEPTHPMVVTSLLLDNAGEELANRFARVGIRLEGQYAYIAAGDLWLVDISNPAAPRQVAFMETPGDAREVVVDGELIYVADGAGGLLVVKRRP